MRVCVWNGVMCIIFQECIREAQPLTVKLAQTAFALFNSLSYVAWGRPSFIIVYCIRYIVE